MSRPTDLLDDFYAGSLGCSIRDLNDGESKVVKSDPRLIRYAKGAPLALYSLAKQGGAVIATRPDCAAAVEQVIQGSSVLDDPTSAAIERAVSPLVDVAFWFYGVRLFCDPATFVDHTAGEVREILPEEDERAFVLHRRWGGKIFGQISGGRVVSWAAVKPLSDVVWDLAVETRPDQRRLGYATSAVSAALKHVFANGRVAGWGCDRTSVASLRTARSVGFLDYALDFGCVETCSGVFDT